MGTHHLPLPAQVMRALCMTCLGVWLGAGVAIGQQGQGSLPDVLIQAEEKRPMSREKPPMSMEVKEEVLLESVLKTEEELKSKLPSEMAKSTQFVASVSQSPAVATPTSNWIVMTWRGESVHRLNPLGELLKVYKEKDPKAAQSKAQWELAIVDAAGRAFKRLSGSGLPPETLDFDGKGDEGKWLVCGQVYSGVLTYRDPAGRGHTAMGRPFALDGLSLQKPGGFVISLSPRALLDEEKGAGRISEHGAELIQEAAQIVQRYHAGMNLSVFAHMTSADGTLVQAAADSIAKELAKRLELPVQAVTAKSQINTPDLEQRVDIQILNR